jgi:ribosomal protein S25
MERSYEKLAEVVQFLSTERAPATAQSVATGTGIPYSLTRDALRRLLAAGVVQELPRLGGARSPLYYEIVEGKMWGLFVEMATEVCRDRRPADV